MKITQTFTAPDRASWRNWLSENGASESEVWLVYFKAATGKPSITYEESLEEALCFGWVDSIIQKIDEESYARKFNPRRQGSKWSELNKHLVAKLIREGRMTAAGMAKVDFPLEDAQAERPKRSPLPPAGVAEGGADGQPHSLGELPEAGRVPPAQLHRLDLGCEAGRDAHEAAAGSHRTAGEE
jgi:hypothetical protein